MEAVKIAVMGQGYVGLPLAMAAVEAGHQVIGFEPNSQRCQRLYLGDSYIEDVSCKTLEAALKTGRYLPTGQEELLSEFDVAVITVPTPLKDRQPELGAVRRASESLARYVRRGCLVILESTSHPGTTRDIVLPILEDHSQLRAGIDFYLAFSPERIDPGNEQWTFANTPKIVSGLTEECRARAEAFYTEITKNVVLADSLEEAELAKVFENTFRHVNVALVNELCRVARTLGVDVWRTLDLAASKPFGFMKFLPGPGVGGHCLPVDTVYLSHHVRTQYGEPFRLVELAQEINEAQPAYVIGRLQDGLNTRFGKALKGARILVLGLAYKAGVADSRQSPAVEVVTELERRGAIVDAVDPHVADEVDRMHAPLPYGAYDAVVLLTAHPEFPLAQIAAETAYVLDTRGVMPDAVHIERL
jgi:UDP-N-acetyl-D-glucosamine dehydrogenase